MDLDPIRLARDAGHPIFESEFDANWIVIRGKNGKPDEFDGLSTLNWFEQGAWKSIQIDAATRPGTHYLTRPMNANGTAVVKPGRHRLSHALGEHKGTPALVQVGSVIVERDNNRDAILDPNLPTWKNAMGINHHYCENPKFLAGCIGSKQKDLDKILDAFRWLQTKRPQSRLSLNLVLEP